MEVMKSFDNEVTQHVYMLRTVYIHVHACIAIILLLQQTKSVFLICMVLHELYCAVLA